MQTEAVRPMADRHWLERPAVPAIAEPTDQSPTDQLPTDGQRRMNLVATPARTDQPAGADYRLQYRPTRCQPTHHR
jgi:hypothetical protein